LNITYCITPLICRIFGIGEIIVAFLGDLETADVAGSFPKFIDGPCSDPSAVRLELCKSHFDWVEVRTVGQREEKVGAAIFEYGGGLFAFMAGKIVEDYDITGIEHRRQLRLHPIFEDDTVHGAVDQPRCDDTVATQVMVNGNRPIVAAYRC
jgi:hypothetical protein